MSDSTMPPVFVLERDLEPLFALLDSPIAYRFPVEADALRAELDRAEIMRCEVSPADLVTMHSTVDYIDVVSRRWARAQIVFPWEANPIKCRVSVLAPLGTALLGLREGATIAWSAPSGREHVWHVVAVRSGAES